MKGQMGMGDIRVRDVDSQLVAALKAQATRLGMDWQEFLHDALADAAARPRRDWSRKLKEMRETIKTKRGELPDSTPGIRAWRDGLE